MRWTSLLLLALLLAAGCGKAGGPLPVTGTVKYKDGSPLAFEVGSVIFRSTDGTTNASGAVQPDGSFTMMTKKPGDGVKPGQYKVAVQLWKNYANLTPAVASKYRDLETSGLEANVDASHTHFDFTIEK
jgi:hypothetical protein